MEETGKNGKYQAVSGKKRKGPEKAAKSLVRDQKAANLLLRDPSGSLFNFRRDRIEMCPFEEINNSLKRIELLLMSIVTQLRKETGPTSAQRNELFHLVRDTDNIPEMITLKEASRRTGLSYDFLRKECLRGNVAHIRVGNGKKLINFDLLKEQLESSHGSIEKKVYHERGGE